MNRYARIAALFGAVLSVACGSKVDRTVTGPAPVARIKFFNLALASPGVDFYANNVKMTAISSASGAESIRGTIYSEGAAGGFYVNIAPGQYTLNGKITDTTSHGLAISTVSQMIENGKAYSFYQSGIYDSTTKKADAFVIEDAFTVPTNFGVSAVRFVNAISNGTGPLVLYAKNQATGSTEVAIGGPVAYKAAGAWTEIPFGVYDFFLRYSGSSTNLATKTGISIGGGRVFSVAARGDATSTTTARRPALDATPNF